MFRLDARLANASNFTKGYLMQFMQLCGSFHLQLKLGYLDSAAGRCQPPRYLALLSSILRSRGTQNPARLPTRNNSSMIASWTSGPALPFSSTFVTYSRVSEEATASKGRALFNFGLIGDFSFLN
jgi:hypothetical protein